MSALSTKRAITRFQSTLLMRGATISVGDCLALATRISIHAPHARSDHVRFIDKEGNYQISIHAPHARSDVTEFTTQRTIALISIHAPHARSDCSSRRGRHTSTISIHAPHARSDLVFVRVTRAGRYFNPRSSCEERLTM